MKLHHSLILLAAAVTAALGAAGCQAEPAPAPTPEITPAVAPEITPEPIPRFTADDDTARGELINLMQKLPGSGEHVTFWDVRTIRENPAFSEIYEIWYDRKIDTLEEDYGIDSQDIAYMTEGDGLRLIRLDYDTAALRERLNPDFHHDAGCEDAEVWRSEPARLPGMPHGGWVLEEGLVVRWSNDSNADAYLMTAAGEEPSQYDGEMAKMMERLPRGIVTHTSRYAFPAGITVYGMSFKPAGDKTFTWTNVHKFESAAAAESDAAHDYFEEIETGFHEGEKEFARLEKEPYFRDFSLERDGEFVTWRLVIDEQYLIYKFFYD